MSKKDGRTMRGFIAGLLLGATLTSVANFDPERDRIELTPLQFWDAIGFAFQRGKEAGVAMGIHFAGGEAEFQIICMTVQARNYKELATQETHPLDAFDDYTAIAMHEITKQMLQLNFNQSEIDDCDLGWLLPKALEKRVNERRKALEQRQIEHD